VRVDRVSLLVPGQDEVWFVLRVSVSQPDAAEVGFCPAAVGFVRITLIEVRTGVALMTVVSAAPTHWIRRWGSDAGVPRSALECRRRGCGKDTLVARGATGRKRIAVDLVRVAIALVLLHESANLADAAVESVQCLLPGFPGDGFGASLEDIVGPDLTISVQTLLDQRDEMRVLFGGDRAIEPLARLH
jgi:hypothetical protein